MIATMQIATKACFASACAYGEHQQCESLCRQKECHGNESIKKTKRYELNTSHGSHYIFIIPNGYLRWYNGVNIPHRDVHRLLRTSYYRLYDREQQSRGKSRHNQLLLLGTPASTSWNFVALDLLPLFTASICRLAKVRTMAPRLFCHASGQINTMVTVVPTTSSLSTSSFPLTTNHFKPQTESSLGGTSIP